MSDDVVEHLRRAEAAADGSVKHHIREARQLLQLDREVDDDG